MESLLQFLFIVSVPFVQHANARLHAQCPGPFIYMPKLYLDQLLPTLLGRLTHLRIERPPRA